MPKTLTTEEFIEKANLVHKNRYDYSQVIYITNNIEIKIVCEKHGIFEQIPNNHLRGRGCSKCAIENKKLTTEEFIKRAKEIHKNKYDYFLVDCKSSDIKVKIICFEHGIFEQTPNDHLGGHGCSKCSSDSRSKKQTLTTEEFIEKANLVHCKKYDYSLVEYENSQIKIQIKCLKHGIFEQTPNDHLAGKGCVKCANRPVSKSEIQWLDYLKIPEEFRHKTIKINGKNYKIDAFNPKLKIIYEFFGDYWHGNPEKFKSTDINKHNKKTFEYLYYRTLDRINLFRENGYEIIFIWESDFKKLLKNNK